MTKGILINYDYCTGCHSCEVACKKELGLPEGELGVKLSETGPYEYSAEDKGPGRWEWTWLPVITKACDLRESRTAKGKMPDVRAALPGVVHVLRRGGGAGPQDGRQDPLGAVHAGRRVGSGAVCRPSAPLRRDGRPVYAGGRMQRPTRL